MGYIKQFIPDIPVPIIKDSLTKVCYTISPKKAKGYGRVRK